MFKEVPAVGRGRRQGASDRAGSAITGTGALLKMSLAAIPLLVQAQRAVARQVHATMGTADHGRCVLLARRLGGIGGALELAPEPYCSSDQCNPEQ